MLKSRLNISASEFPLSVLSGGKCTFPFVCETLSVPLPGLTSLSPSFSPLNYPQGNAKHKEETVTQTHLQPILNSHCIPLVQMEAQVGFVSHRSWKPGSDAKEREEHPQPCHRLQTWSHCTQLGSEVWYVQHLSECDIKVRWLICIIISSETCSHAFPAVRL